MKVNFQVIHRNELVFPSFNKIYKICEHSVLKIAEFPETQLTSMKSDWGFILRV